LDLIRALALGAVLWLGGLGALPALAQTAWSSSPEPGGGLDIGELRGLAQDGRGYLWIAGDGGLVRYDGGGYQRWGALAHVHGVYRTADGAVAVRTDGGEIFSAGPNGVSPLTGPDGRAPGRVDDLVSDGQGTLWALTRAHIWRRDAQGRWQAANTPWRPEEVVRSLSALSMGVAAITNRRAVVIKDASLAPVTLMEGERLGAVLQTSDAWWVTTSVLDARLKDHLWRIPLDPARGGAKMIERPFGRFASWVERNGVLWMAADSYLMSIGKDGVMRVRRGADGVPSGGPLLVDREGSLWLGTFVDLLHFPEPDSYLWTEQQGLSTNHTWRLAEGRNDIFITTWRGADRLNKRAPQVRPERQLSPAGSICADAQGVAWRAGGDPHVRHDGTGWRTTGPFPRGMSGCFVDPQGREWLATELGLVRYQTPQEGFVVTLSGYGGQTGFSKIWPSSLGRFWLSDGERSCKVTPGLTPKLSDCFNLPDGDVLMDGAELPDGSLWIIQSSHPPQPGAERRGATGLAHVVAGRVTPLPGNLGLPGSGLIHIRAARSGGYWVSGAGSLLRLAPCESCAEGWRVLERPGAWQGLPPNSAIDALEAETGDLWVAGNRGVFRIPEAARHIPAPQTVTELAGVSIEGRSLPPGATVHMGPDQHNLLIRFSALSFRDAGKVVYRYRLDNQAWSPPRLGQSLQLIAPRPGRHRLEIQSSLDGVNFGPSASMRFEAEPPLLASPAAYLIYALLAGGLIWFIYRLRLSYLVRRERDRLQLAMDIHDELGSSLSSISVLAAVAGSDRIDAEHRRNLSAQIMSIAHKSGVGVRTIGQTLVEQDVDARKLGQELASQARRLFPGATPELVLDLPQQPGGPVFHPHVRRQVLMILLEALHNAKRHSQARQVTVSLEPTSRDSWRLEVRDDGQGFSPGAEDAGGAGLENMQRRAATIGGQIRFDSQPGRGTHVVLQFSLAQRPPLWRRLLPV
jgi:ligand-binding sensor domain-containing protein/signal transduction histidine kinase